MIDCQVAGRIAAELAARQRSGRSVMVGQRNVYECALKWRGWYRGRQVGWAKVWVALLGLEAVGVAGALDAGDEGLDAEPEPPGHIVRVKSDSSLQTVVRTSSGLLYAALQVP